MAIVPDWILTRIVDHGANVFYRYTVEGTNMNWDAAHPMHRFSWRIPAYRLEDPRYDTSGAQRVQGAP